MLSTRQNERGIKEIEREREGEPRSRDFGSPQCRQRLYVIGVKESLQSPAAFASMVQYFDTHLAELHEQAGVSQIVEWVSSRIQHSVMQCGAEKKDCHLCPCAKSPFQN